MAKTEECCPMVGTSLCRGLALVTLIVGTLFLLQDLGIWAFWNISWYTIGFILVGLCFLLHPHKK